MSKISAVGACVLAVLLSGCVSQQAYDAKVKELTAETARYAAISTGLQVQNKKLEADLTEARASIEKLKTGVTEKTGEFEKIMKENELLKNSLVAELKEVPGVLVDAKGGMQFVVSFALGGVELSAETRQSLEKVAKALANWKSGHIYLDGHGDNVPVAQPETKKLYVDNLGLSLARAAAVARFLVEGGVESERLIVRGFGSTQPVASNDDPEGRAKNRRVEVRLVPAGGEGVPPEVKKVIEPEPKKEAAPEPAKQVPPAPEEKG